jgi:hypothetical protein
MTGRGRPAAPELEALAVGDHVRVLTIPSLIGTVTAITHEPSASDGAVFFVVLDDGTVAVPFRRDRVAKIRRLTGKLQLHRRPGDALSVE